MNMQVVRFQTSNPIVPEDMLRPEVRARAVDGAGVLLVPDGPADRFPAVVISEGLGGLKPEREFCYATMLAKRGFAVLVARPGISRTSRGRR